MCGGVAYHEDELSFLQVRNGMKHRKSLGSRHSTNGSTVMHGVAIALVAYASFSVMDALIKDVSSRYPVFEIAFFAALFSVVPVLVYIALDDHKTNFRPKNPGLLLIRGLTYTGGLCSAFYAFSVAPFSEVYAVLFIAPMLVTVLSVFFLGEKVRIWRWSAIFIGLVGVLVVVNAGVSMPGIGHLSAVFAAICVAVGAVIVRHISSEDRSTTIVLFPILLHLVVTAVAMLPDYVPPELGDLALMAFIGLLSVFAVACNVTSMAKAPASIVAPMQYSQIIWAILIGAFVFGETVGTNTIAGGTLIIASGAMIVWREGLADISQSRPVSASSALRPQMALPQTSKPQISQPQASEAQALGTQTLEPQVSETRLRKTAKSDARET